MDTILPTSLKQSWKRKPSVFMAPTSLFAERDFFTNKLLKVTPNISQEAINQSIAFLKRQKEANCPCTIHNQKRGYEWIVFNRLPDRMSNHMEENQMSESDDSVEFSDTENHAENEDGKVADTTSGHEHMEEDNKQEESRCIWCIK